MHLKPKERGFALEVKRHAVTLMIQEFDAVLLSTEFEKYLNVTWNEGDVAQLFADIMKQLTPSTAFRMYRALNAEVVCLFTALSRS